MKKLALILPVLVIVVAAVFFAVHRREKRQHVNREARAAAATHFSFDQQLALVNAACGNGKVSVDAKKEILCSACPVNSEFANGTGLPGDSTGWTLDGALPGSFTAANQDEALVHAVGCEPHVRNNGGDFLMRRTAGQWTTVRYAPGGTADDKCQKLPWPGDREALVCDTKDMHQGIASDAVQLLLFDEKAPEKTDFVDSFFFVLIDESANCGYEPSVDSKPRTLQLAHLNGFEVLPEAADGNRNVAIDATIYRVQSPSKPNGNCPAGHPQTYHMIFDNQGDYFDAGEGYVPVHALRREDCCDLTVNARVRPGLY